MAIQSKILTRQETATVKKVTSSGEVEVTLTGNVGALAIGKPGDIMTRAYGPVVRALRYLGTADIAFGTFVDGMGILVNSNDCAAVSEKFETVKTLKKGELGSFLVSGACIVPCDQVSTIAAAMKVQEVIGYSTDTGAVCEIEVNGFDNDIPVPSSL